MNTVFRLESVMKELNQLILLSADFRDRLPESEKLIDLDERREGLEGNADFFQVFAELSCYHQSLISMLTPPIGKIRLYLWPNHSSCI